MFSVFLVSALKGEKLLVEVWRHLYRCFFLFLAEFCHYKLQNCMSYRTSLPLRVHMLTSPPARPGAVLYSRKLVF